MVRRSLSWGTASSRARDGGGGASGKVYHITRPSAAAPGAAPCVAAALSNALPQHVQEAAAQEAAALELRPAAAVDGQIDGRRAGVTPLPSLRSTERILRHPTHSALASQMTWLNSREDVEEIEV
eukprot:4380929-Prymnesium_polylepis.2